ncbi:MAG TPA: prolyl oligopeptidase family serine peptidase [Bryobacteraceae bacterium]|jgi:dienelactone hydrolase|nr:prolyl oligopeptidase family serine peptidase [Bryobacteraceae bacterium]
MLRKVAIILLLVCSVDAARRPPRHPRHHAIEKRVLRHTDYDSWRHIQNQELSNDGRWLAYALFPQQGDGEVIVRELATGKEMKVPAGALPPPPPPNYANPRAEDGPRTVPGVAVKFSADSRTLVFSTFAPYAEVERAKREKRNPDEMPRGDLVAIDLASGKEFRAPRVKSFQLPPKGNNYFAYLQAPQQPATPARSSGATAKGVRAAISDLVLHKLSDGSEKRFSEVTEYALTKDGQMLVYAVSSMKPEANGVYVLKTGSPSDPVSILSGKGQYEKLAWDQGETRLAFLSNRGDFTGAQPRFAVYGWDRHNAVAAELVSTETRGFRAGWIVSDKAAITFSQNGTRIFFGTAPKPPAERPQDKTPTDERVSVDLWSWKDDYIQPMQKVRAAMDRSRSYRAVYDVTTNRFVQLADPGMAQLTEGDSGLYAVGEDDRPYRRIQEYDRRYSDAYTVDNTTGARKLVLKKHIGRLIWSPDSRYTAYYDGKDWNTIAVPSGQVANLTSNLGVSFGREDYDSPSLPPAYGLAGWTRDGQYVLLYDRFDVWRCKPDGSEPVNLTHSSGRNNHIVFRIVRYERTDPAERGIDPAKPILLRAEDDDTHDSGFYRTTIQSEEEPEKLVMEAKNFTPPIKARDAEVYVLAASTFDEYPDLSVTGESFQKFHKVSDANPQLAGLLWGTAELIHYKSTDGVPLEGTLYKPANFDPSKKYPLMVYIYERLSQNVHNFIEPRPSNVINPSYYASNGYLVLEPDIAYKIGYPGQSALDCVLPAVQEVVDKGFVDEKAIGIQGHSWGGYQIAYMVTRTNRFRAAAPGAPVADMISAYDGIRWGPGIPRQFQYEHTQSRIGGSLWQYPMRYIENSPIFAADRVTTPLLMIANDADDAVPWYQGIEFYLALRRLDKEVYLFSYNGEPHNLRRRADQKDYTIRLQQFFDYYLKGAPKPDWMDNGIPYLDKEGVTATDTQ